MSYFKEFRIHYDPYRGSLVCVPTLRTTLVEDSGGFGTLRGGWGHQCVVNGYRRQEMGRNQSVDGGRPVIVTVRLSREEARMLDRLTVGVSRSTALRLLVQRAGNV